MTLHVKGFVQADALVLVINRVQKLVVVHASTNAMAIVLVLVQVTALHPQHHMLYIRLV